MSQSSVINFLKKHKGKKFTLKQLSDKLKISYSSIGTSTLKIRKRQSSYSFIKHEWIQGRNSNKQMRLVYWYDDKK